VWSESWGDTQRGFDCAHREGGSKGAQKEWECRNASLKKKEFGPLRTFAKQGGREGIVDKEHLANLGGKANVGGSVQTVNGAPTRRRKKRTSQRFANIGGELIEDHTRSKKENDLQDTIGVHCTGLRPVGGCTDGKRIDMKKSNPVRVNSY